MTTAIRHYWVSIADAQPSCAGSICSIPVVVTTSASSRWLRSLSPISKEGEKPASIEGILCIMCCAKRFTSFHPAFARTLREEFSSGTVG